MGTLEFRSKTWVLKCYLFRRPKHTFPNSKSTFPNSTSLIGICFPVNGKSGAELFSAQLYWSLLSGHPQIRFFTQAGAFCIQAPPFGCRERRKKEGRKRRKFFNLSLCLWFRHVWILDSSMWSITESARNLWTRFSPIAKGFSLCRWARKWSS